MSGPLSSQILKLSNVVALKIPKPVFSFLFSLSFQQGFTYSTTVIFTGCLLMVDM